MEGTAFGYALLRPEGMTAAQLRKLPVIIFDGRGEHHTEGAGGDDAPGVGSKGGGTLCTCAVCLEDYKVVLLGFLCHDTKTHTKHNRMVKSCGCCRAITGSIAIASTSGCRHAARCARYASTTRAHPWTRTRRHSHRRDLCGGRCGGSCPLGGHEGGGREAAMRLRQGAEWGTQRGRQCRPHHTTFRACILCAWHHQIWRLGRRWGSRAKFKQSNARSQDHPLWWILRAPLLRSRCSHHDDGWASMYKRVVCYT